MRHSLRTFAAAVSIAAAGLGVSAGVASAAPVQLTEAAPIDGTTEPGTGSAESLGPLLELLATGSAGAVPETDGASAAVAIDNAIPATPLEPGTGSAESLGPLLELLATGSSGTQNPAD